MKKNLENSSVTPRTKTIQGFATSQKCDKFKLNSLTLAKPQRKNV